MFELLLIIIVVGYFKEKGVHAVYSTKAADDLAVEEASKEFISRFKENRSSKNSSFPIFTSACPGESSMM